MMCRIPGGAKTERPLLPAKSRGGLLSGAFETGKVIRLGGANPDVRLASLLASRNIVAGAVTLLIPSDGVVYATTTSGYALDCAGVPALVRLTIVNSGVIGGCGGSGGAGGYWAWEPYGTDDNGTVLYGWTPYGAGGGAAGGPALRLGGDTTLKNIGRIYGGGNGAAGNPPGGNPGSNGAAGAAGAGTTASGPVSPGGSTWGVSGAAIVRNGNVLMLSVPGDIKGSVN
jgi:hypothetical protein